MILLKRLELQGFKSFANKTVFDFPSRITAIVGPNGSGKSNVMDALRWILGERDAKHLRGEKLENLIFAGTPKRGAAGLAKVTLYFNNQDNYFSTGDLAEVVLSRKIDRSGVSKFFLNNEEILLRDVAGFLAKAKLGSRGLAMISQGESDIFVKSTATERRLMIEEILGLREYRLKKNSAEKSLAASEINLEKVRAMLEELAPHLRLLRRQKNRWEKRKEIEDELLGLENSYFLFQFRDLKGRLAENETSLGAAEKEGISKKEAAAAVDAELKAFHQDDNRRERLGQLRAASRELVSKKSGLERELIKLEVKVETATPIKNGNRIDWPAAEIFLRDLRQDFEKILAVDDLVLWRQKMNQWFGQVKKILFEEENSKPDLISQPEDFSEKLKELKNSIADLEKELSGLIEEEERLLLFEEKNNQGWRVLLDRLEEAKLESDKARDFQQRLILEKEKLNWQFGDLKNRFEALGRSMAELENIEPQNIENNNWEETERRILRLRGELAAIGEIDSGLVKEAEETESRFQTLSAELADLEKASVDLHRLIKDLDLKISDDFKKSFRLINDAFNEYFRLMFNGGKAHLKLVHNQIKSEELAENEGGENSESLENKNTAKPTASDSAEDNELVAGVDIELSLPKKKISALEMLSGGEKSLVSMAALFALISISPPPFLVLDEIDATLDEMNARRFADLIKGFSAKTQFIVITHNRATMETGDVLYGITMGEDGVSKVLSLKLE